MVLLQKRVELQKYVDAKAVQIHSTTRRAKREERIGTRKKRRLPKSVRSDDNRGRPQAVQRGRPESRPGFDGSFYPNLSPFSGGCLIAARRIGVPAKARAQRAVLRGDWSAALVYIKHPPECQMPFFEVLICF